MNGLGIANPIGQNSLNLIGQGLLSLPLPSVPNSSPLLGNNTLSLPSRNLMPNQPTTSSTGREPPTLPRSKNWCDVLKETSSLSLGASTPISLGQGQNPKDTAWQSPADLVNRLPADTGPPRNITSKVIILPEKPSEDNARNPPPKANVAVVYPLTKKDAISSVIGANTQVLNTGHSHIVDLNTKSNISTTIADKPSLDTASSTVDKRK